MEEAMQSRNLMSRVLGVAFSALSAITSLQAQGTPTVFHACYTRIGGVVYRIKEPLLQPPILRERCASADHVQFSWTSGVADHGLLTGLLDDDHTQYLLGNGTRALTGNLSLGGFVLTNLGAASGNGQAVRFEQAVKTGDAAGGDLSGSYPNPSVAGLRGNPVASTSPVAGNVLTFNGAAWAPAASPSGGVTAHGALTGLTNDDHPQYLLAAGTRALTGDLSAGGNTITNLAAASANGQAVRFEQAVKTTDPAGGDVTGSFANVTVAKLRGNHVSATGPTTGQVLTFNGTAWAPAAPPSGGGVTVHGQLSGLEADNHPQYVLADGTRPLTSLAVHGSGNFSGELLVNSGLTTIPADGGIISFGTLGVGSVPGGGAVRMMWYPGKAAFRAGSVDGAQWDDANIGDYSTAQGRNTIASAEGSTALGRATTASGFFSTALGFLTTASGQQSTALGAGTIASGANSAALGFQTTASGNLSTALGFQTIASGEFSTALGDNTTASGNRSTALGNNTTASGERSTAMGRNASTNGKAGTFVYGDFSTFNSGSVVMASADNQFMVRAAGGTIFYSNADLTAGVSLSPGGGAWASVSDRNRKENFRVEDGERVLAQIAHMPLQSWNYKTQAPAIRHLGPTAQDFYAAFHLGESDTTINTVDADGVNLLAVQALERRTAELRRENEELRAAVARLEAMVRALVQAQKEGH
jgi:hypothetical protein